MKPRFLFPTSREAPSSAMRRIADAALNLLYPESCFVCGIPVSRTRDHGICPICWEAVLRLRIEDPWCAACGLPMQTMDLAREPASSSLCVKCSVLLPAYSGSRSFGYYTSELSKMIQAFKFDGRRNLVSLMGPLLAATFLDSWRREEIDLLVPVPLHRKKKRERGFNQSAMLARALGRLVGMPCREEALTRVRYTMPQVGLPDTERLRNLKGAFACKRGDMTEGLRVLLVDDVMTTGATAQSAAEALLEAGARRVSVITVARAVPGAG